MRTLSRHAAVVLLSLALVPGSPAVCAGWLATPEARMACCLSDDECPMHKGSATDDGTGHALTQAEADSCCAASEPDDTAPSAPSAFAIALPAIVVAPLAVAPPAIVKTALPHLPAPLTAHVSKHLLLSVLLV